MACFGKRCKGKAARRRGKLKQVSPEKIAAAMQGRIDREWRLAREQIQRRMPALFARGFENT